MLFRSVSQSRYANKLKYGKAASKTKMVFESLGADFHIGIAGWLAWIEVLDFLGIPEVKEKASLLFRAFYTNLYDTIQLSEACIVIERPKQIHRDARNRLHCLTGPAVGFDKAHGCGYFISGVSFPEELFNSVTKHTITAPEIIKITNIEHRRIALEQYGYDNLIRDLKSETVEISPRGNELYKIAVPDLGNAYLLRYRCPSTDRVYVSPINATAVEEWTDRQADRAMARKFSLTLEEYDQLEVES